MRVTICELSHEAGALATEWARLCEHTWKHESELVLLPELAMAEPVWEAPEFAAEHWRAATSATERWVPLLGELHATHVVATRAIQVGDRRYNQGYRWSARDGITALRSKSLLPDEPGGWERRWFDRGEATFPLFRAGSLTFGLNICTELWALESYASYAASGAQVILSPRATSTATTAKWLSIGVVAAVRSGAYSVSSNRVDASGAYGGAGWIIDPDGQIVARTTSGTPFLTVDLDLAVPAAARQRYPRYVLAEGSC